ncbi:Uncharacterised protein [Vibrio cholerae]|nr:Uncharacterised protein [Vibrio cholerae]CSB98209.1 Uncharacterised protein [Vibrio cholerae]CSC38015.1 Uncharacterised protein [Vibrio cholerae]
MQSVQAVIWDHVCKHFHRVMAHYTQVSDTRFTRRSQTSTDTWAVHFNAEEVFLRCVFRHFDQGRAHAKTNLQHNRIIVTKHLLPIQQLWLVINPHGWPALFHCGFLAFGQTTFTTNKATNTTQHFAIFGIFLGDDFAHFYCLHITKSERELSKESSTVQVLLLTVHYPALKLFAAAANTATASNRNEDNIPNVCRFYFTTNLWCNFAPLV